MQYQVFVQSYANNGFIAAVIGMPDCLAEGQTKEEAVANALITRWFGCQFNSPFTLFSI